ncbi:TPA: copper chaperone PCu(A)C [Neisseria bacilliformis]|uniref:copper chaperone PCu(A)C n=1 Tax=Neisseria bacilliformis TaxID=267212 RepID=UPI000667DCF7|nr:copper chaperone PCu(A)C [Neisseria bacilliformis]
MKKLFAAAAMVAMCQAAFAEGVVAQNSWARETVGGMKNGGVFLDLENDTPKDIVLVGGTSPVAKSVEIHEHVHAEITDPKTGQKAMGMKMQPVPGGLKVAKGEIVSLKPGSYHVMLMGLKKPLKPGDKFPVTLKFKGAKDQTVQVEVRANDAGAKGGMQMDHGRGHAH